MKAVVYITKHRDGIELIPGIYYNEDRNYIRYEDDIFKLTNDRSIDNIICLLLLRNRKKEISAEYILNELKIKYKNFDEKCRKSKRNNNISILKDIITNFRRGKFKFLSKFLEVIDSNFLKYKLNL